MTHRRQIGSARISRGTAAIIVVTLGVMIVTASVTAASVIDVLSDRRQRKQESGSTQAAIPLRADTLAEQCEKAPLSYVDEDGTIDGKVSVFDRATLQMVTFGARDLCRQQAELSPDPAGDMVATFFVENGLIRAEYFELTRTFSNGVEIAAPGDVLIPGDEAARRLAEQRAARDF